MEAENSEPDPLVPQPPAHDHTSIPIYKLYGYGNEWQVSDPLFCETIAAQEKLHNWHVAPHKHVGLLQLLLLESGGVQLQLDGHWQTLQPPMLILVPQQVTHEFVFQPASGGFILTVTYAMLREVCKVFLLELRAITGAAVLPLDVDIADDRDLVAAFRQLNREYHGLFDTQRGPLLRALLGLILSWVQRRRPPAAAGRGPDPGQRHLARYLQLVEEHHCSQHQVAWYAGRIGVTAAHLNSIAQALTGKKALQLIHDRLLLEARRELIYTARPVALIADSLGFQDPGYFSRFFKRLTGQPPRQFRQQMRHQVTAGPTASLQR